MEFSAESKVVPEPSGTYTYLRDGARVENHLGAEQDPGSAGEPLGGPSSAPRIAAKARA
jgi:hypothetical protein